MIYEKVTQFVLKLIKLTKSGELQWTSAVPTNRTLVDDGFIADKLYDSTISGKYLRVYRYRTKDYEDDYNFIWIERVSLQLIDIAGNTEFEYKYEHSFNDLYAAIREQVSGADQFIDEILAIPID
ncbi:hypothetical protein [Foetidibacter luteolus]|uniref:hypothetical protein n=1 Tax=Foetidibacter luteolus TaxID=2608880 RepID=UPI00129B8338|nr:hypothetical protein [Foetidibacter luteolus]